jgi:hypothetical protein
MMILKRVLNKKVLRIRAMIFWFSTVISGGLVWAQIKLQVPQRVGNFLSNSSTDSFLRLTQFHEVSLWCNTDILMS